MKYSTETYASKAIATPSTRGRAPAKTRLFEHRQKWFKETRKCLVAPHPGRGLRWFVGFHGGWRGMPCALLVRSKDSIECTIGFVLPRNLRSVKLSSSAPRFWNPLCELLLRPSTASQTKPCSGNRWFAFARIVRFACDSSGWTEEWPRTFPRRAAAQQLLTPRRESPAIRAFLSHPCLLGWIGTRTVRVVRVTQ